MKSTKSSFKNQTKKVKDIKDDFYESSEDEDWGVDEPLINVFSFGWTEDGRCGIPDIKGKLMQKCPMPLTTFKVKKDKKNSTKEPKYICKTASAGSRHSLFLMIDSSLNEINVNQDDSNDEIIDRPKRSRKVLITGLNQVGLCEEDGYEVPIDLPWDSSFDRPVAITAGRGNSFIVTKAGHVFSFGQGRYGILGHGDSETLTFPRRILSLERQRITQVAVGAFHAIALTDLDKIFSWGRNNKGQLGIGYESEFELTPKSVDMHSRFSKAKVVNVSCGFEHSIALLNVKYGGSNEISVVVGWGDESRGQLGSGDRENRNKPQENHWLTKLTNKLGITLKKVVAGGYHNLALVNNSGQVISWGAGDYGQLGHGFQFDDPQPKFINNLIKVIDISAGLRHSVAVCDTKSIDVYSWGYNGYGELGLGDTDIRLSPTRISALKNTRVIQVSCGERHTLLITSHKPLLANELPALKPYFRILEEENWNKIILRKLKRTLAKERIPGVDSSLLDDPKKILPNQAGNSMVEIKNDIFEQGLRYCLDTFIEENDWRRKAMEACFECFAPNKYLHKVCLSCARNCLSKFRLRPYIRHRMKGDVCDCHYSGMCVSIWTPVRQEFDLICGDDACIGPNQIRKLLKTLKAPFPIENVDVEDCLAQLADGKEEDDTPRINPVPFERWYRKYYDELDPTNVEDIIKLESQT